MIDVAILAHRGDRAAAAIAAALRGRGGRVALLDDRALSRGLVHHRPDSGRIDTPPADLPADLPGDAIAAPGGQVIDAGTGLVLCRLTAVPPPAFADPADRDYAAQELFALAVSWLHGLGSRVVNRPTALSLVGANPDRLAVQHLALGVGLRPARKRMWTNRARVRMPAAPGEPPLPLPGEWVEPVHDVTSALVCGDTVLGAPPGLERLSVALVRAAGLDVAEVLFAVADGTGEHVVLELSPVPALLHPAYVDALARHLELRAGRGLTVGVPA